MTGKAGDLTGGLARSDPGGHSDWDDDPVLKVGSNFFVIKQGNFISAPGNEKWGVGREHTILTSLTLITKS